MVISSFKDVVKSAFLALLAALLNVYPANVQYFGKNKLRYEDFNYQILQTKHFDIYHYLLEEKGVRDLGRLAEHSINAIRT